MSPIVSLGAVENNNKFKKTLLLTGFETQIGTSVEKFLKVITENVKKCSMSMKTTLRRYGR